ncbi:MAG: isochorismatase family protein [Deltaproteobacteria bacterium]|nr:isochorismatase family protein [Deltaproteobacteria bacterium]
MRKRVYVDVDTQWDFCAPEGALFVSGAVEATRVCVSLIAHAVARGEALVGSVDSHAHDAWEFATNRNVGPRGEKPNFPPHCVKGTRGWLKMDGTLPARFVFVPMDAPTPRVPDDTQAVYFEKEVYSLFSNANAARWIDQLGQENPLDFVVFGVATDYCVQAAARDALAWIAAQSSAASQSTVTVVRDAIAAVDPAGGARALAELEALGVRVCDSSEVLAR